jgi:diphosphomevalonate decarboxylase
MPTNTATALAHPNIAFIKYWGNRDETIHLPLNGSLSMCLDGLYTTTTVTFSPTLPADTLTLDGNIIEGAGLLRVQAFLNAVRRLANKVIYAQVESANNFPAGAGIASSASAFAALALASTRALSLHLPERDLSRLARLGSGSACRSVPGGFVEWQVGESDLDSYAFSIAPPDHWNLLDLIVIVNRAHKATGSAAGMALAHTSPLQKQRVAQAPQRLDYCRQALLACDFAALAEVMEIDSKWMHAVMQTSTPPLHYLLPATEELLDNVLGWRSEGHAVCATVDAGPNVHVICLPHEQDFLITAIREIPGVLEVITASPGGAARLLSVAA